MNEKFKKYDNGIELDEPYEVKLKTAMIGLNLFNENNAMNANYTSIKNDI